MQTRREAPAAALRPVAGVDVGGTFTDVVLVTPEGDTRARKVLTTPDDQGEGVTAGVAAAWGSGDVPLVAHGTTTATNAVLERAVARTVLVTTEGFADVLVIARQDRPALYDLAVTRPAPLVPRDLVVTARERIGPDGSPIIPLDDTEVERVAETVAALEPAAVAISLLFSYANPAHEARLAAAIEARLDVPITRSSALVPEFREYERTSTCTLNAAVAPVMRRYLTRLGERLPASTVTVMTSGGGTAGLAAVAEAPVHTLLSGPAAGVVAAAAVARAAGFDDAVAFDMGGTSTDVCLIRDGRPEIATESAIGGLPFRTPAVAIHTVGAGGGSIAWVDAGGALRVGPRSAGARPGPACYGLGGTEPTVTDAHCVLGHFDPAAELGGGQVRFDVAAAAQALGALPPGVAGGSAAAGVLTVVQATMVRALRRVTTEQGVDPNGLALVAYGGAGPLHASALARELGCPAVLVPPAPGVLSALGLLLAPPRAEASRTVLARIAPGEEPVPGGVAAAAWDELEQDARAALRAQGIAEPQTHRVADCRYAGQSHELRVAAQPGADLAAALHAAHTQAYGYAMPDEPIEVVTLRVIAEGRPALAAPPAAWDLGATPCGPRRRRIALPEGEVEAAVVARATLGPGDRLEGPAVVEQADATTLLAADDVAEVDAAGNLVVQVGGA
jgi:N-methylhydantoinase A